MHNYQPGQNVRILTIRVAVPEEMSEHDVYAYLNAVLDDAVLLKTSPWAKGSREPVILDWDYGKIYFNKCPVIKVGDMPEEGSAFTRLDSVRPVKEQRQNPDACAPCEMGIRKIAPDDPRTKDVLIKTIVDFICRPNVEVSMTQKRDVQPRFDVGSPKAVGFMVGPITMTVAAEETRRPVFMPSKKKEPAAPKTLVKLAYFKASGKYYSSGTLDTDLDFWDTVKHVRELRNEGHLPGLCEGAKEFAILIEYGDSGMPHFLPAKENHE